MRSLHFLCAALAPGGPSDVAAAAARDGSVRWNAVMRLARTHRVAAPLWVALRDHGLLESAPEGVRNFLAERAPNRVHVAVELEDLYRANIDHAEDLLTHMRLVVGALNTAGIEPMPLKGIQHIVTGLIADPAARNMIDVDLLVHEADVDTARRAIIDAGYEESSGPDQPPMHHGKPFVRTGLRGSVEIHRRALAGAASGLLSAEDMWSSARPLEWKGLRMRAAPPTVVVLHSILHAQIGDRMYRGGVVPVRSLHDSALLDADRSIDWLSIRRELALRGLRHIFDAHVCQLHVLFGRPYPAGHEPTARARAHHDRCLATHALPATWQRALRSVLDVRYDFSAGRMRELFPDEPPGRARLSQLKRKVSMFVRHSSGVDRF